MFYGISALKVSKHLSPLTFFFAKNLSGNVYNYEPDNRTLRLSSGLLQKF